MPDPRRDIGGSVWARAEAVSKDAKRIYGTESGTTWLRGVVLEVLTQRKNASSKRSTTYVKATYMCGNTQKITILPLQVLKDKDPSDVGANNNNENNGEQLPHPPPQNLAVAAAEENNNIAQPPLQPTTSHNVNPASSNNGRNWYEGIVDVDANGPVPFRSWRMTCQYTGRVFSPNCDVQDHNIKNELSPIDFFMASFPKDQLRFMVEHTSASLRLAGKPTTTMGELLKWMGVTLLMTRFEFGNRATLWSDDSGSQYVPAANIGTRTGMSHERYDLIQQHMAWSFHPLHKPQGMSSENHRWMHVDDFVKRFNDHRKKYFMPCFVICVDESISRWYGLGGHWINMGLPMYVAIDRKPEDGCEIQNACCGKSGIMMQLKLVRTSAGEVAVAVAQQQQHEEAGAVADANGYVRFYCCLG